MNAAARRRVVIGVGNEFRRDDGLGPAVLARLRELSLPAGVTLASCDGEPTRMIELWSGADLAVVVDAVHTGADHGGHLYQLVVDELAGMDAGTGSSHRIGFGATVELARALGRLPRRLVVYAVDGVDFGFGCGLTPQVEAAVGPLAQRISDDVRNLDVLAGDRRSRTQR